MTESYVVTPPDKEIVIMHSLGTVGICLLCVSKHLQSLAEKNCNYKLQLQFPLCAVQEKGIDDDTKYKLNLQACVQGDSLQLHFWLTIDTAKRYDLGIYTVPISSGKSDLEKMTHLSCRITLVMGASKDDSWLSWGKSWFAAADGVSRGQIEFIGPETPSTANKARDATGTVERVDLGSSSVHLLYLMHPNICRIVAEHNNPRITDLSTTVPNEAETQESLEITKFDQRLQSAHLNASPENRSEKTFKALEDAFPGVIGRERGVVGTQPKLHMEYTINDKPEAYLAVMQKNAMRFSIRYDQVHLRLFKAWPHVCGWQNNTLYQPVPSKPR